MSRHSDGGLARLRPLAEALGPFKGFGGAVCRQDHVYDVLARLAARARTNGRGALFHTRAAVALEHLVSLSSSSVMARIMQPPPFSLQPESESRERVAQGEGAADLTMHKAREGGLLHDGLGGAAAVLQCQRALAGDGALRRRRGEHGEERGGGLSGRHVLTPRTMPVDPSLAGAGRTEALVMPWPAVIARIVGDLASGKLYGGFKRAVFEVAWRRDVPVRAITRLNDYENPGLAPADAGCSSRR